MSKQGASETEQGEAALAALAGVPDVGDTFRWEDPDGYMTHADWDWSKTWRVTSWMQRRPAPPEPRTDQERMAREIIGQLQAEGKIDPPRGFGPDDVPLRWCLRNEAGYLVATNGLVELFFRVRDVKVTGHMEERSVTDRHHAELLGAQHEVLF